MTILKDFILNEACNKDQDLWVLDVDDVDTAGVCDAIQYVVPTGVVAWNYWSHY